MSAEFEVRRSAAVFILQMIAAVAAVAYLITPSITRIFQ